MLKVIHGDLREISHLDHQIFFLFVQIYLCYVLQTSLLWIIVPGESILYEITEAVKYSDLHFQYSFVLLFQASQWTEVINSIFYKYNHLK